MQADCPPRVLDSMTVSYPSELHTCAAVSHRMDTEPVICVSVSGKCLGVSDCNNEYAPSESVRAYFFAIASASAQVERSGYAGPDAIMSGASPKTSDNTTEKILAGETCNANLPPLTAERRLRIVLISVMSAPLASN